MRQAFALALPRWLHLVAWMETLAGAVGLLGYLNFAIAHPYALSTWHHLLAVAFFGANLIAGTLLLQAREPGVRLSFIVQLLQIVFWNSGVAWIARAGLHITPTIASTGVVIYAGGAAEFLCHTIDSTFFGAGTGPAFALKFGVEAQPLDQATIVFGVNVIALYFTLRLRKQLASSPQAAALATGSETPRHYSIPWALPLAGGAVGFVGLFMLFSGPRAVHRPNRRWIATTGDTLEVFTYEVHTKTTVDIPDELVRKERYLWVQFHSDFHDTAQDRANAAAVAQMTCHVADSAGVGRILVQPTEKRWVGLLTISRNYSFNVDTAVHCSGATR